MALGAGGGIVVRRVLDRVVGSGRRIPEYVDSSRVGASA